MTSDDTLNHVLNQASPVPDMPSARLHDRAMDVFPASRPIVKTWAALAATVVLGVGGLMAFQSYQAQQQTLIADADAFAEQLVSEAY